MITNRRLVNPRVLGLMLIAASVLLVTTGFQNAVASVSVTIYDILEEAAEAGNATMTAAKNQTASGNMTQGKFLSIQSAQSGSLSEINATAYSLELNDVSDKTILFSDRPDRIVTSVSTSDFVGNWTAGQDSFSADPPNAVLVVDDAQTEEIVVELFDPMYYSIPNAITYDIVVENATSIDIPNEFGQSILVIDSDPDFSM